MWGSGRCGLGQGWRRCQRGNTDENFGRRILIGISLTIDNQQDEERRGIPAVMNPIISIPRTTELLSWVCQLIRPIWSRSKMANLLRSPHHLGLQSPAKVRPHSDAPYSKALAPKQFCWWKSASAWLPPLMLVVSFDVVFRVCRPLWILCCVAVDWISPRGPKKCVVNQRSITCFHNSCE